MRVLVHVTLASMVGLFAMAAFVGDVWYRVAAMFAITWGLFCIWAYVYADLKKLVGATRGLK